MSSSAMIRARAATGLPDYGDALSMRECLAKRKVDGLLDGVGQTARRSPPSVLERWIIDIPRQSRSAKTGNIGRACAGSRRPHLARKDVGSSGAEGRAAA